MRILVIDDDPTITALLSSALRMVGHEPLVAEDGEQGWERFLAESPDVVLTDRSMPGIDGIELCRRIRTLDRRTYPYVILITAMGTRDEIVEGMEAGADDYLVKPPDPFELRLRLMAATRVTAVHRRLAQLTDELQAANDLLDRLARTDPLTDIGNRLRFQEDLISLHASAARHDRPYAVGLLDIDHFKQFNDRHGHPAGDEALRRVAQALAGAIRTGDTVYRYGGEELVVLMPETGLDGALTTVDRLRHAVRGLEIPHVDSEAGVLTLSAGVASLDLDHHDDPDAVVDAADQALYRAKARGRDLAAT